MGAHSTTQSSLGQERGGSCGAIRPLEPKKCQKNTFLGIVCYGLFHPEIGTFRNPLQIHPFMLPIEYGLRFAVLGIREGYDTNDEDYLFVVPTRREIRAGRGEGASRRCSGNAWDLRPSSPQGSSSLADIDSCSRTLWRCSVIVFRIPLRDRRLFLSVCRQLGSHFPLKHLEQLVDPAGFNLAVRRHFINEVWQQARQLSARGIG